MKFSSVALFAGAAAANMAPSMSHSSMSMSSGPVPSGPAPTDPMHHGPGGPPYKSPSKYTTSVVYETQTHTVTSCPPTVTNCPADHKSVVTSVVAVSTTICPVEEAQTSGYAHPTGSWGKGGSWEGCDPSWETCTVTVTGARTWGASPTNGTWGTAHPSGTGSPVSPTNAYYSNAANSLAGGVAAVGGLIVALFV